MKTDYKKYKVNKFSIDRLEIDQMPKNTKNKLDLFNLV